MGRSVQARWGMCGKVRDGEVAAATCSVLQDIMGYLDLFSSAATSWGCLNKQPDGLVSCSCHQGKVIASEVKNPWAHPFIISRFSFR